MSLNKPKPREDTRQKYVKTEIIFNSAEYTLKYVEKADPIHFLDLADSKNIIFSIKKQLPYFLEYSTSPTIQSRHFEFLYYYQAVLYSRKYLTKKFFILLNTFL